MLFALLISTLAGLSTIIGGVLATHKRVLERKFLAMALAFSAGAMLFVSFVELLPLGMASFEGVYSDRLTAAWIYGAFFVGILGVALIDRFLPKSFNPNETTGNEDHLSRKDLRESKKLLRGGILVAIVLALHNFPEGVSTFFAATQDLATGAALAIAIAIHNIPEGIAVAAPIYAATKSRKKAFWWAALSGLTEPVGALVGFGLLQLVIPTEFIGVVFGLVAGMMVFIAIDELLPAARRYQTDQHQVAYGLLAGMIAVATSLLLIW